MYGIGAGMNHLLPRPLHLRHVVFSDDLRTSGQAINLTPRAPGYVADATTDRQAVLSERDEALVGWILRQVGLIPSNYKPATLARRFPACLRALRCADAAAARKQIERNPVLVAVAVNALVIGVTSFFRDPNVFRALADSVLPDLLTAPGPLRVWSAGCSDGQEVYSLAMLLAELGATDHAQLLGTDCRETAVRRAAEAVYDGDDTRSVPPDLRDRYLEPRGGRSWRVRDALRRVARFRVGDALRFAEPGTFDLICCRNMAIYLNPLAAGRLWQTLESALRPGGVLVLGKAEAPIGAARMSQVGPSIFRRTRG